MTPHRGRLQVTDPQGRPPSSLRQVFAWIHARAGRARLRTIVELAIGVPAAVVVLIVARPLIVAYATALIGAAASAGSLLRVDPSATATTIAVAAGKLGLATLPALQLLRTMSRRRRLWAAPLVALLVLLTVPISLAACATLRGWALLAAASFSAFVLSRVRWMRWSAVLPLLLLWEVAPRHGLLMFAQVGTDVAEYRARLLADCVPRAGTRPMNLIADLLMPYHGITAITDDLVLLSGEGPDDGNMRGRAAGRPAGSWWLRRRGGRFEFHQPSGATGNLWRGCVLDGTIWMARANGLVAATPMQEADRHERVRHFALPSSDMDFGEAACDPDRSVVYVTEGLRGGMWEFRPDAPDAARRTQIGGPVLLPKRRADGRVVLTDTATLFVFSPADQRVEERIAAGVAVIGFDLCATDGAAAVADAAGRLRVFERDGDGHYAFAWGVSMFAPRRVAFSPDCARIAVTSADDRSVHIIDRAARRIVDGFSAGPALREVTATGPAEFSVADVCSMTTYRAGPTGASTTANRP